VLVMPAAGSKLGDPVEWHKHIDIQDLLQVAITLVANQSIC
jgi:hypothetical protein